MNNTIDQSLLPNRLRESTFRQYEKVIATATSIYPRTLTIRSVDIKNVKFVTFIARLRDSMSSLHTYRWETSLVDMDKFLKHFDHIRVVRQNMDTVYIGGAESRTLQDPIPAFCPPPSELSSPTIMLYTAEQKELLCQLASFRLLARPLKVSGLSENDSAWLKENFDVTITPNSDGTNTIV